MWHRPPVAEDPPKFELAHVDAGAIECPRCGGWLKVRPEDRQFRTCASCARSFDARGDK